MSQEARVRKLEREAEGEEAYQLIVDWGDQEEELEPGTVIVDWTQDDQIVVTRVRGKRDK